MSVKNAVFLGLSYQQAVFLPKVDSCHVLGQETYTVKMSSRLIRLLTVILLCNLAEKGELSVWWEEHEKSLALGMGAPSLREPELKSTLLGPCHHQSP